MAGQFELGSKHIECMKLASQNIAELKGFNTKEAALKLLGKTYGFFPSESQVYDDYLGLTVSIEEIAKVLPGVAAILADQVLIREILKTYADNNVNAVLAAGEIFGILCSESGLSSLSNISAKAVRNSGQWTITGVKQISNEWGSADKYLLLAKDEEELIRIFIITEDQINLKIVNKSIGSVDVSLRQAEINLNLSDSAHAGIINDEMEFVQTVGRTLIAATAVGIAHSSLISSINVSKEVKNDAGQSLSSSQNIQFTLADMFAEIEASRMLTYLSANSIDEKKPNVKYATMAKVKASNIAAKSSVDALYLLGNIGYISNTEFASNILRAVDTQVKGGTNRNQLSKIYQYMLAKK